MLQRKYHHRDGFGLLFYLFVGFGHVAYYLLLWTIVKHILIIAQHVVNLSEELKVDREEEGMDDVVGMDIIIDKNFDYD